MESELLSTVLRLTRPILPAIGRFAGGYEVRIAGNETDLHAALRLRYAVFNEELGEGLADADQTGRDQDDFDAWMRHLIVVERASGTVVGTYRIQTGRMASNGLGFYSAREFDFSPYRSMTDDFVELGRACIHRDHRSVTVLLLLWQGIADFARSHSCRYLIGCSSLTSQDPAVGWSAWDQLSSHLAPAELQTRPLPTHQLPSAPPATGKAKIPRLLRAYLGVGARICGRPALDREFGTIDFLTLLDLKLANPTGASRFLKTLEK
jgi:putative hemolysin